MWMAHKVDAMCEAYEFGRNQMCIKLFAIWKNIYDLIIAAFISESI